MAHRQCTTNRALPLGNAPCGPSTIGAEGDDPTPGIAAEANGVASVDLAHGQRIVNRALPLGNAPCGPSTIGAEGDDPTPGIAAEANGVAGAHGLMRASTRAAAI